MLTKGSAADEGPAGVGEAEGTAQDVPQKTNAVSTQLASGVRRKTPRKKGAANVLKERIAPEDRPFIRAENEDDDGYDPYSDRRPHPEPLFERDPWD